MDQLLSIEQLNNKTASAANNNNNKNDNISYNDCSLNQQLIDISEEEEEEEVTDRVYNRHQILQHQNRDEKRKKIIKSLNLALNSRSSRTTKMKDYNNKFVINSFDIDQDDDDSGCGSTTTAVVYNDNLDQSPLIWHRWPTSETAEKASNTNIINVNKYCKYFNNNFEKFLIAKYYCCYWHFIDRYNKSDFINCLSTLTKSSNSSFSSSSNQLKYFHNSSTSSSSSSSSAMKFKSLKSISTSSSRTESSVTMFPLLYSVLLLMIIACFDQQHWCHCYDSSSSSSYSGYPGTSATPYGTPSYQHYPNHYQTPIYQQHNYRKYYKPYVPMPQYCPETGRTVCSKVAPYYPTDEVFALLKTARAKHFNISSEFVDESENFANPHLDDMEPFPEPEPFSQSNVHQQPHRMTTVGTGFGHHHLSSMIPIDGPVGNRFPYSFSKAPIFQQTYSTSGYSHDSNFYSLSQHQQQQRDYHSTGSSTPMVPYQSTKSMYRPQATHNYHNGRYKRQAGGNSNDPTNEPICPSRIILIEPKAAMNDKRQWKFVVNLSERDPRLKQAIKVEVCSTPNEPCSDQISLPFGFISRCRQKYIKKKMISLDPSGQSISSENFFAPSCCVCEVIRADEPMMSRSSSNQINTISKPAKQTTAKSTRNNGKKKK